MLLLSYRTGNGEEGFSDDASHKREQIFNSGKHDLPTWQRLSEPQPGDWLYRYQEPGQTFDEYKQRIKTLDKSVQDTIYIQPLGEVMDSYAEVVENMREYCELFFTRPTVIMEPIPLPEVAYYQSRRQYDGGRILYQLSVTIPTKAAAYIGVTNVDLFSDGLNFVFGLGNAVNKCGIYSIYRYQFSYPGQPENIDLQKRALKVMAHELGHIFHLDHCVFYGCVMNGSNSLPESDRRPIHLCPLCLQKLQWGMDFEIVERYQKLSKFFKKVGYPEEADLLEQRIEIYKNLLD